MAAVTTMSAAAVAASADEVSNAGVSANDSVPVIDDEGYVLVSEETRSLDDFIVVEKCYIKDSIAVCSSGRGTLSIKNEIQILSSGNVEWVEMTLNADFNWNTKEDTVKVTNAWGDAKSMSSGITLLSKNFDYKSDQGKTALGGKKYGYIVETAQVDNGGWHGKKEFSYMIDVNVLGEIHRTEKSKDL